MALSKGEKYLSGIIYVVGIGPGDRDHMTFKACEVLKKVDVIIGYGTYIELIEDLIEGKEIINSGMTKEIERARQSVKIALDRKSVV